MRWTTGTLRTRPPEETWDVIQPLLREAGCTRVADLTNLDPTGIPVHTAIRPAARSLCVAQGKGLTAALSRVSAAMESLECWHAEQPRTPDRTATPAAELPVDYPVTTLDPAVPTLLDETFPLDWVAATTVLDGGSTYLPATYVSLDRTVRDRWGPPLFTISSNGLASGNTVDEALLHALCELVERESIHRARGALTAYPIDVDGIADDSVRSLVERITSRAGGRLALYALPNPLGVPCIAATTRDDTIPLLYGGFGCHPDPVIATTRAITEAVQNRVAMIAGSRDDLPLDLYTKARLRPHDTAAPTQDAGRPLPPGLPVDDLAAGVRLLAKRVRAHTGYQPVAVTLSRPDDPVATVRVVAPGLRGDTLDGLRATRRQP